MKNFEDFWRFQKTVFEAFWRLLEVSESSRSFLEVFGGFRKDFWRFQKYDLEGSERGFGGAKFRPILYVRLHSPCVCAVNCSESFVLEPRPDKNIKFRSKFRFGRGVCLGVILRIVLGVLLEAALGVVVQMGLGVIQEIVEFQA